MHVHIKNVNDFTVMEVVGRLDTLTAGEFESKLFPLTETAPVILVDCSGMEYISSTGLRAFLLGQRKAGATGGQLLLCSLQPAIREIFDMAGFSTIFTIYPDQESALMK